jgi:hypothetical protein
LWRGVIVEERASSMAFLINDVNDNHSYLAVKCLHPVIQAPAIGLKLRGVRSYRKGAWLPFIIAGG